MKYIRKKIIFLLGNYSWKKVLLIGITLTYLLVLLLVPIVALVKGAFSKGGFYLFQQTFQIDALKSLGLTLLLAFGAAIVNGFFGVMVSWILVRHRFFGKKILNALVDLPFAVSPVVAGYMLVLLFGRRGYLGEVVDRLGLQIVFSWPGMFLATTFITFPFIIRAVMPILQEIGRDQEDAASTLGANPWQIFFKVTFPNIRWGLLYGVGLTLARAVGEFGAVFIVSGAIQGKTESATLFIFRALDERLNEAAYGVSILLALMSFGFLAGVNYYRKKEEKKMKPIKLFLGDNL